MTDINKLIHDLRQPGGDDRDLSDRFALALGWSYKLRSDGNCWLPPGKTDNWFREFQPPLFTSDLTAIVGTLREADRVYSISAFPVESSAAIGQMTASTKWHYAPTAERALMIARLAFKKETGG